jgi:peptidoglycan hydrolase-like protein with peptidoglycan-binding domain
MALTIGHSVGAGGVNDKADVIVVQGLLNRHMLPGAKHLDVDGICGPSTRAAIVSFQTRAGFRHPDGLVQPGGRSWRALTDVLNLAKVLLDMHTIVDDAESWVRRNLQPAATLHFEDWDHPDAATHSTPGAICWGAKVSAAFKTKVIGIANDLGVNVDYLMACMAWESGYSFSASMANKSGSTAVGLIQMIDSTARGLGTTRAALTAMTPEQQLTYVEKYLTPFKGHMSTLQDMYLVILTGNAGNSGKPASTVLYSSGSLAYTENSGLDTAGKGTITIGDVVAKVQGAYTRGLQKGNIG